jgi:hypothetical protein
LKVGYSQAAKLNVERQQKGTDQPVDMPLSAGSNQSEAPIRVLKASVS